MSNEMKRLYRSQSERMISGVCGGLGNYLGMDPTVVRLIFVLVTFFWPFTPIAYLLLMLVVPEEPVSQSASPASTSGPEPAEKLPPE
jgi:phage shock protein C